MDNEKSTRNSRRSSPEEKYRKLLHSQLFHPALQDILPAYGIHDTLTPHYVSSVLVDYSHSSTFLKLKNRIVQESKRQGCVPGYAKTLERLHHVYIEDMERTMLSSRKITHLMHGHKSIGDYSLIMLGMFPKLFKKDNSNGPSKYFNKEYFIRKGSDHYARANSYFEPWYSNDSDEIGQDQFEILSENFERIVNAIDKCNSMHWSSWGDGVIIDPLLRKAFELIN